jgi:hypothetical protein
LAAQLYDEGATDILDCYFRSATEPATFYAGLGNGTRPTGDTTIMTGLTEVTGTGYARQAINSDSTDFPTLTLQSSEVAVDSKQVTFTCSSGTWSTYNFVFLTTTSSGTAGKLIASWDVGTARALAAGESYKPTLRITLD